MSLNQITDRRDFLLYVMTVIHSRGYIYDSGVQGYAGFTGNNPPQNWAPPAMGTRMSCQGAAKLMRDMALHLSPQGSFLAHDLKVVSASAPNMMLFPWRGNMKRALGTPHPTYVPGIGWMFQNHFRLRDLGDNGRLYDPTFCTSTHNNYTAIAGSNLPSTGSGTISAVLFGTRYLVITNGMNRAMFELNQSAIHPQYEIKDTHYS